MRSRLKLTAALCAIVACSTLLALANTSQGDYPRDAGPAMNSLLDGDVSTALAQQPVMGGFSLIVRLPFSALARATGGDDLRVYQLGTIPCLIAVGLLGLALAGRMRRRGQPPAACVAAATLCLVNPLTWEAIRLGHPEELLCGALCVGAVLAALRGRTLPAAVLLGLALATKQWAVIAVLPVLAAAPTRRVRLFAVTAGIALLLTVPLMLGNAGSFSGAHEQAHV